MKKEASKRRAEGIRKAKETADFHARVAKAQGHPSFRNYKSPRDV